MSEEELRKQLETTPGFFKHNHYKLVEVEIGKKVILEANLTANSLNPYGYAHGGLIFGLGDHAMGIAVGSTGRVGVTQNANITYLRPTKGKKLRAEAEIIKQGKVTCYLRCNFYDDENKLTASMDANYFYMN